MLTKCREEGGRTALRAPDNHKVRGRPSESGQVLIPSSNDIPIDVQQKAVISFRCVFVFEIAAGGGADTSYGDAEPEDVGDRRGKFLSIPRRDQPAVSSFDD